MSLLHRAGCWRCQIGCERPWERFWAQWTATARTKPDIRKIMHYEGVNHVYQRIDDASVSAIHSDRVCSDSGAANLQPPRGTTVTL